jgi:hypothetical protein
LGGDHLPADGIASLAGEQRSAGKRTPGQVIQEVGALKKYGVSAGTQVIAHI